VPLLASEAKALHTRKRDADRIGVVAMRGKSLSIEMGFQAFDPLGARDDPEPITPACHVPARMPAQSFKTTSIAWRHRGLFAGCQEGMSMSNEAVLHPGIWQPVLTLLMTSVVIMGSPGPSTMSATAVGAAYGFRRSLRYVCGLVLGTTLVLFAVAAGVLALLLSIPHAATVLLAASSIYILYLAFRIATAPPLARQQRITAPAFAGGLLLAIANPKAYLAIAAVFAGTSIFANDQMLDAVAKTAVLTMMIVIIHACWLVAGATLSRTLQNPISSRVVNLVLATTLVIATVIALLG
jgi:threonine/homoserine/homoserine lactone efflux protein